jgi:hypothetical protein
MVNRYEFNGLYCPRAADFLPADQDEPANVAGFLEQCCIRLERQFPEIVHVKNLAREIRLFAADKRVKDGSRSEADEFDEIDELQGRVSDLESELNEMDLSLPE